MVNSSLAVVAAIICCSATPTAAFLGPPGIPGVAWGSGTKLSFGFNGLGTPKEDTEIDSDQAEDEKKISAGGLFQLITAGMGAPFLGDYQGVSDDGKMMFTLEANNLVDENGNSKQTQMPYFENGWVEEKDESDSAAPKKKGWFGL